MTPAPLYNILINEESGAVKKMGGAPAFKELLARSAISYEKLYILPSKDLFKKIESITADDPPPLIGGGDGTMVGASRIMLKKNIPFGILPLGTMNLLAQDLEIPIVPQEALQHYARGFKPLFIDVASVNDEIFLCSAAIGMIPESSTFREENRDQIDPVLMPRLTLFVLDKLDQSQQRKYYLTLDGKAKTILSSALVVSNNQYKTTTQWNESGLKRPSLQAGIFGVYSATPKSFWDKLRLLFRLGFGGWRNDPHVKSWSSKTVRITTTKAQELVSLDGETLTLKTPLDFSLQPQSLQLLVPR